MATKSWYGSAAAVTEVQTVTITSSMVTGSPVGVKIGQSTVSYTVVGGDTTSTAAAALYALLAASTAPEILEITWSYPGTGAVITGAEKVSGAPFTMTAVGPGGAVTFAYTKQATGPNDVSNVNNWSGNALPVNGDDVVIEGNVGALLYGMSALSGISLNSFTVKSTFVNSIGLPAINGQSTSTAFLGSGTTYPEYRTRYLALGGNPAVSIGVGPGAGSPRINLNVGTGTTTVNVFNLGSPSDPDGYAMKLINGGGSTNKLDVIKGKIGVATETGATATLSEIRIGDAGNPGSDSTVVWGSGATITNVFNLSGNSIGYFAPSGSLTMGINAGAHTQYSGNMTASVYGGTLYYATNGTLTINTATNSKSVVDFSKDPRVKGLNGPFTAGATLYDPGATWAAGGGTATFDPASLKGSNFGPSVSITR